MSDASDEQVLRFVDGELEPGDAAALEQQAARDPGLRARIDALVALRATLATDPDLDGTDVLPSVRAALRAQAPPRPRLRLIAWSAPPAVLLAAALAFVVVQRQSDEEEFHAKGAGGPATTTGVAVFRQTDRGLAPVSDRIGPNAALAFSYTNSGSEPFTHLMVFAVDDDRGVSWYWPAYGDERADPSTLTAVTATPGRDVELGDVVRHALAPGPLTIYAVFLRRAATVAEVEGAIGRGVSAPFDLGDDVTVQAVPLVVTP